MTSTVTKDLFKQLTAKVLTQTSLVRYAPRHSKIFLSEMTLHMSTELKEKGTFKYPNLGNFSIDAQNGKMIFKPFKSFTKKVFGENKHGNQGNDDDDDDEDENDDKKDE